MQFKNNLDAIQMQLRCILHAIKMHSRCNSDAIWEEVEGKVAMFTTFTGGLITSQLSKK